MATVTYLDNGLKVILNRIPNATAVSVWVGYKIGSRNECPGMTGSSHWIEHMLFKGGGKLKKGEADKLISRLGGISNAFTDTDFTVYFDTVPSNAVDIALFIEAEKMRNAAFDLKEVDAERTVVISEREGAENMPEFLTEEQLWATAFQIHPYHWLPIGWKQDLQNLDRDSLYHYYLRYYAPNNAVLIVVGGFNRANILKEIKKRFGKFKKEVPPDPLTLKEPPQTGERRATICRPGSVDHVEIGWHIPEFNHEDTPKLIMFSAILGGWRGYNPDMMGEWTPRSNRLYKALIKPKLATDVVTKSEAKIDPSLFVTDVTVMSGITPERVESVILAEIEKLKHKPPSKTEMRLARTQIQTWSSYENDGVTFKGMMMSYFELIGGYKMYNKAIAAIDRVNQKDIQEIARKYLTDNSRTVVHFIAQEV